MTGLWRPTKLAKAQAKPKGRTRPSTLNHHAMSRINTLFGSLNEPNSAIIRLIFVYAGSSHALDLATQGMAGLYLER